MAINSKRRGGLGVAFVLLALTLSTAWARTGAEGTPVPFPQAPTVPSADQLQSQEANLQGFLDQADQYIRAVHSTTERYRQYVAQTKELQSSCEVEADLRRSESHPFAGVMAGEGVQCRENLAAFKQMARQQAARLDKAVAFQKQVQEAAESAQRQIDRIRLMQHARRLKAEVEEGFRAIDDSKEALKPWLDQ